VLEIELLRTNGTLDADAEVAVNSASVLFLGRAQALEALMLLVKKYWFVLE